MSVNVAATSCNVSLQRAFACFALFLSCVLSAPLRAQEPAASLPFDRQAEAVEQVVLGILSYVRWPVEPAELSLCVVGPTEYADGILRGLVQASGRAVQAERKAVDDPQLGALCHAVYLGIVSDEERQQVFRSLNGHAVLSISERDPACSIGSMFCLKVGDRRVTFEVNLDSVARSGMRVHPSVLRLGRRQSKP